MPQALLLPIVPLAALVTIGTLAPPWPYRVPEDIPYWAFFFGLPHIVSSLQTLCDQEYIAAYRRRLAVLLALCFAPLALHTVGVPSALLLSAVLVLTVHHVVAQQYGIALALTGLRPSTTFALLKWSTLLLGTAAYLHCYASEAVQRSDPLQWLRALVHLATPPLMGLIMVTGALLVWRARARRAGVVFLVANIAIFLLSLLLLSEPRHALIGLMLARILHDVTGFVVYIGHDSVRNRRHRHNLLYRAVPAVPVWLANPVLALGIAAALTLLARQSALVGWLVVGITLAHYYAESVIWRGGSPHRQSFRLTG